MKLSPLDRSELDRALVERYESRFDGLQAQVQRQQHQFEATHAEQRKLTADLESKGGAAIDDIQKDTGGGKAGAQK